MGKENQVDLKKSVDELNEVIDTEEKREEDKTVSMLAKAMEKLGLKGNSEEVDLTKSETPSEEVAEEVEEVEVNEELEAPSIEEAVDGNVDASEFIEKSLEYMGGVHELVKALKDEVVSIRKENADLKKSLDDSGFAMAAMLNSHKELHKALKSEEGTLVRDIPAPSKAQTLEKSVEEVEVEADLVKEVKDGFDDAEINILAKAVREKTITNEEYAEAKRTFTLPKRLLS